MSLALDRIAVRYGQRIAVHTATLELEPGSIVALVGPNGAGKSSLLKAIAGLIDTSGTVTWRGEALEALDSRARARSFAYLPQTPQAHWPMTVGDLVALGRLPHRAFGAPPSSADREAIDAAMRQTEVVELAERAVSELSGGEHARVQLARALAVRAPVLLVDEPVASLDPYHQLQIMAVLEDYAVRDSLVIAVLHDLTLAARYCSRLILMHDGRVVEDGPPDRALSEDALRAYYRVQPYLARFDDQLLVVPWRTLD